MTRVLVTGGGERLAEVAKAIRATGAETTVVDTLDRLGEAVRDRRSTATCSCRWP